MLSIITLIQTMFSLVSAGLLRHTWGGLSSRRPGAARVGIMVGGKYSRGMGGGFQVDGSVVRRGKTSPPHVDCCFDW